MENKLMKNPLGDDKATAIYLANYGKRIMEKYYTQIFETSAGQKIKDLGKAEKYIAEFLLYAVSVAAYKKLPDVTVAQKVFKDVVMDSFPEIAKRMLNGENGHEAQAVIAAIGPENILDAVLEKDAETLVALMSWLKTMSAEEQKIILEKISSFPIERIKLLMSLASEDRKIFLQLSQAAKPKNSFLDWFEKELTDLNDYREERKRR